MQEFLPQYDHTPPLKEAHDYLAECRQLKAILADIKDFYRVILVLDLE